MFSPKLKIYQTLQVCVTRTGRRAVPCTKKKSSLNNAELHPLPPQGLYRAQLPTGVEPQESLSVPSVGLEGFQTMTDVTGLFYTDFRAVVAVQLLTGRLLGLPWGWLALLSTGV